MKNIFNSVKMTRPPRNRFDLTHDVKLSCNMGRLVPIMAIDAIPGDKFNISCESLLRLQPMVAPPMHRINQYIHYFFVPYRILWPNWEKFITNTPLTEGGNLPAMPTLQVSEANYAELHDYMGIPNPIASNVETINAFYFAAYQMINNEYYRDQNLMDPIPFALIDGDNTANAALTLMRNRCWEHDYFTSALPFAQKGAAVDLPLGKVELVEDWSTEGVPRFELATGAFANGDVTVSTDPGNPIELSSAPNIANAYDPQGTLEVEPTTVNSLRIAIRVQQWLEKAARGGSRLTEWLKVMFGVNAQDARLQRPEYITGTQSPIVLSEVLNTTGTDEAPQGQMAGHGLSVTSGRYGNFYVPEHGVIMGIMSVLPKTAYQQGIEKAFLKRDPTEFYFPDFANLGEQPVLNKELYAFQGATGNDTFGYLPRYTEYKYQSNRVAGDMRGNLNFWHMGRIFPSEPALNAAFVESDPTKRIFAVTDPNEQECIVHVLNKITASRLMPKYGIPTF